MTTQIYTLKIFFKDGLRKWVDFQVGFSNKMVLQNEKSNFWSVKNNKHSEIWAGFLN